MKRLAALLGLGLLLAALGSSQASAAGLSLSQAGGAQFPQRAFLLSLSSGAVLTSRQISVKEDGQPVHGLSVEPASAIGQSHFGTVLVIDTSDSMSGAAEQSAIQAARAFIKARNPLQPVGIVLFDQTARVVAPMTTSNAKLDAALANVPALHSGTHLFDAVASATRLLAAANLTGGSVVVVSDGRDTGSHTSEQSVANTAAAQGVRVYTVGVQDSSFDGTTLRSLAAAASGIYTPVDSQALVPLYHGLGVALSNQYLIRYVSRSPLGSKVAVVANVTGHGVASLTYSTPAVPPAVASGPPGGRTSTSFWSSTGGAVLVSILCAVLLGIAILALIGRRNGVRQRVGPFVGFLSQPPIEDKPRSLVQRALGDPNRRQVDRSHWSARLAEDIDVARIQIAPTRLAALTIVATILLAYALFAVQGPLAALLGLALPFAVRTGIKIRANRQRNAFGEQLPDNLSVVASALRAGNTFAGSLGVVASDAPEPSRRELRRALADEQLGVPLVDALNKVSDRMQSSDFQHVALVATLQQETGGNTAEVLDVVTDTIRERLELRRLVRTLTAQGRLAGGVLSALPVLLLIALTLISPNYSNALFHKTIGIIFLIVAAIMVTTGSVIIRRIVDIDV
jgi:tight adherence protein B